MKILHTHKNIYTHLTYNAPVYTTIATTTMTHLFRYYNIQWIGTLHVNKGGVLFVYIQ